MREELIQRRERARDQQEAVLERYADRRAPEAQRELAAVLREYEQIQADVGWNFDMLEFAQLVRYQADVLYDIGGGQDTEPLRRGLLLYNQALGFIGDKDPLRRAKVMFNRANTLRGLGGTGDLHKLEEARDGYREALGVFQRLQPALVPTVTSALSLVERQIAALQQVAGLQAGIKQTEQQIAALGAEALVQGGGAMNETTIVAMLFARYKQDVAAGKVTADRKRILDEVFSEMLQLVAGTDDPSTEELFERNAKLRQLMSRMGGLLSNPSDGRVVPTGTRRETITRHLDNARRYLIEQSTLRHKPEWDSKRVFELTKQLAEAQQNVRTSPNDDALRLLERDTLRILCFEVRTFARRWHLALAAPAWSTRAIEPRVDVVYFSGGTEQRARLAAACKERALTVFADPDDGLEPGESRWRQLRTASVAVFDMTVPIERQPAICYELGLARVLGTDVVVLADRASPLPFDIEVDPVFADEDLGAAIDRAFFEPLSVEAGTDLRPFLQEVEYRHADPATPEARFVLRALAEAVSDPTRAADLYDHLSGLDRQTGLLAVRSAWAAGKRAPQTKRCFHVMPFGPAWSSSVRDFVKQTCEPHVTYVRGDAAEDTRIIHSIWNELYAASHVVVDLTGMNRNVLLELGIAHGLGRRTILLTQGSSANIATQLIPSLAKFRVTPYDANALDATLKEPLARFLASNV